MRLKEDLLRMVIKVIERKGDRIRQIKCVGYRLKGCVAACSARKKTLGRLFLPCIVKSCCSGKPASSREGTFMKRVLLRACLALPCRAIT